MLFHEQFTIQSSGATFSSTIQVRILDVNDNGPYCTNTTIHMPSTWPNSTTFNISLSSYCRDNDYTPSNRYQIFSVLFSPSCDNGKFVQLNSGNMFCAVLCCAVLYCTVLCCTVLCCTVLCCAVLCMTCLKRESVSFYVTSR